MASMNSATVESHLRLWAVLRAGRRPATRAGREPKAIEELTDRLYDGSAHKGRREADSDGAPARRADAPRDTRGARARPRPMVRSLKTRKR